MDVSIIIVSWNTRERLRRCLSSIVEQTRGLSYEVVVVDNASADGSQAMVETDFPRFRVIQTNANLGFSKACNIGMQASSGRYVLLLNPDVVLKNNAVQALAQFLEKEPDYGAATGNLSEESGERVRSFKNPASAISMFLLSSSLRHVVLRVPALADWLLVTETGAQKAGTIGDVHGALFMARRLALQQVNFIDEAFFLYLADTDLSIRILRGGWKLGYTPEADVMHVGGASAKKVFIPVIINYHLSRVRFFVKHFGAVPALVLLMLSFIETLALLPFWVLRWVFGAGKDSKAVQQLTVNWRLLKLYGSQLGAALTRGTLFDAERIDGTQRLIGLKTK